MYKSDWIVVGGFNVEKYTKWGGEDWDVLDRLVERDQVMECVVVLPSHLIHCLTFLSPSNTQNTGKRL